MAGFYRDAIEGKPYAQDFFKKALREGVIEPL
jgi:hypothetical protein